MRPANKADHPVAFVLMNYRSIIAFLRLSGGRSLQQAQPADLLSEAQNILGQAAGSVEAGIHSLVDGLFGPANSFLTQIPSDIQNLCEPNVHQAATNATIKGVPSTTKDASLDAHHN